MSTRLRVIAFFWSVGALFWAASSQAEPSGLKGARVVAGQLSNEGELLIAGPEGATLSLEQGSRLEAKAGARFRFGKFMKLPMGSGPDPMIPARVLNLEQGLVTTSVPEKRRFAVLIMGPRKLRAILSEGQVTMVASEERAAVATHEGRVLYTLSEKWRSLAAGAVQVAMDGYPEGLRRAILGMPGDPKLSRRLLLEGAADESSTVATWPKLEGAVAYDVELSRNTGELMHSERTREARLLLGPFTAGDYRVSVRGVDASGLPGALGSPVGLNVVGLDVPKTASRARSGAVRLQPGQRVGLLGADGLEVGYLGLEDFLPAPKTLGLVARRPISMHLRHPGSGETVRLELEPMTVRAQISFAREPHAWPKEGLAISVRLIDEEGYEVPEEFSVSCKVTVNIAPTEPSWERTGSTLHTLLERPESNGPWMVRVEVADESGIPLGKDFTEVAYAAPPARPDPQQKARREPEPRQRLAR